MVKPGRGVVRKPGPGARVMTGSGSLGPCPPVGDGMMAAGGSSSSRSARAPASGAVGGAVTVSLG